MGVALDRREILEKVAAIMAESGLSLRRTCALIGESPANILRWRDQFTKGGLEELEPKTANCGRRATMTLNETEELAAKQLYVQTGSKTSALRMLAHIPECRPEVAECILKKRRSKHTLTKTLRNQLDLPQAVMDYHKSPTGVRHNAFINPRTLEYIDALGERRVITPGDLFERDDMSNNFLCWVPWPWGGDPCSDKYGVRVARGQNLLMIDVASLYFTSFNFLVRMRDSYRADDIWQWIGHTYRDIGMPRIGERWERGTWQSRKLRGDSEAVIEAGHTDEALRLGGMGALGLRVIVSQSPTTKIIENRFNFFQTICATIKGQIGRKRGEMEEMNKIWTACRNGHRDPREYFLSFEEVCDQVEQKLHYVNSEPVEGTIYHGVPAAMWKDGIDANPLKPMDPERGFLFSRDKTQITASKGHVCVRKTAPDGRRGAWWFHHEELYRYDGLKCAVYYDQYCVEAGATLVVAEGRHAGKVLGGAELVDGCPQFALGSEDIITNLDGLNRKRGFMDAVRSEYRSLGLGGKRLGRVARSDDGAGRRVEISHRQSGSDSETPSPAGAFKRGASFDGASGGNRSAVAGVNRRTTKPEVDDEDTLRREVEALEHDNRLRGNIPLVFPGGE